MIFTDCENIRDMLPDYIGRGLTESENTTVIRHLASCRGCREETALLIAIKKSVAETQREVPPDILDSAFDKLGQNTRLGEILSSGSVFMAFDILHYVFAEAGSAVRFACGI